MANLQVWYGNLTGATANRITITDGRETAIYDGQFNYYNGKPFGVLQNYTQFSGNTVAVTFKNLNIDANTTFNLINSNQPQAVLQLALQNGGAIIGSYGADVLLGYGGNTYIAGGGGNDTIVGGTGINTACYTGKLSDYTVKALGSGSYSISDHVNSRDGTDTLTNIQNISFSDGSKTITDLISPIHPVISSPASISLATNQSIYLQNVFTTAPSNSIKPTDMWVLYDAGPGNTPTDGHIHINNGYILKNNSWSKYSGDLPTGTYALVMATDFAQTTYSAPKIVGVHDNLYAGYLSNGEWSNIAHTTINT